MYLKALEIQGFKSFPDKTVLSFTEDITAIVGPNGSGKSNISDAIRWVMGEQSTRALRGGKMEDVIFGGTAKRKQLGFAEVSLVLDNTEHIFPNMEESEVMVTRRYYRSGESEYYINRRSVRLRDVNELFMDTGLGREGYSIIGQGKIDEILSVKSSDRREVFEEAAGISRYRHRKEEAERRLEKTEENLVRINDKIDELELQVEPLRVSAEKAKKFLILRDELRGLEISLWLEQLDRIRTGAIKLLSDYDNAVRQREEAKAQVEKLYAAAEAIGEQMHRKEMDAEGIRFEMMGRQADANECEKAIEVLKTNIQNNIENTNRLKSELEAQEGRAGSIESQIAQRRDRLAVIQVEMDTMDARIAQQQAQADELGRNAGSLAAEMEALRQKAASETASAAEAKALLSALAAAAQEVMDRDGAVRKDLAESEERLAAAREEAKAARKELEEARENRDSIKNIISGYALRLDSRNAKLKTVEERHGKLQIEQTTLQSRIHMLREMEKMYEGYSKAVKMIMGEAQRGQLKGMLGPVAGLLRVSGEYAVAIETALGSAMQNIVVETEEHGKAAIQYLKRRDGGRCTFLPLDAIRPQEFQETGVMDEPGFVGMGDELIECDGKFEKIFAYLLGRTVIAEDMDAAIALARKYKHKLKIVTLDGQVLNPGGSMTGGSASKTAGILSRQGELERLGEQEADLREKLAAAGKELEEARREVTGAQYEMDAALSQQRQHEDDVLKLEERVGHLNQAVADQERQRDEWKEELNQLDERSKRTEADTATARKRIEELEGAAAALSAQAQAKAQGQEEARKRSEAISAEIAGINAKKAALEAEALASRQSLRELEDLRRDMVGDREDRSHRIQELKEQNGELNRQIGEKEEQLQRIKTENAAKQAEIKRINQERLDLEKERTRADKESRDKNNELLAMEREVSVLEQKKTAAEMEEKQILDKLWETYELTHEAARAQRVELESVQKAQRRVGELKRSISNLGNINLDAIEEFQRVNERYTYFVDQRGDVQKAKTELLKIINDVTAEMERIFGEQFGKINEAFQQTFLELFGGGKATLELENPQDILNCGIEIKVQPPGKSLKIITLLSGGEKAFVAIALYFAILKVRPTPFVVMDEIEAALDDQNVARFAHYMRNMSDHTQFIVITHRRGTMEEADSLYGVTMQEQGVTRVLTIQLNEVEKELNIK